MAYDKDFPIWRDAMRRAVDMELAARSFPCNYMHGLGAELGDLSHPFYRQYVGLCSMDGQTVSQPLR